MQITSSTHFVAAKECPFTFRGQNLVELRRAKLRPIAKALGLDADGTKNEILQRLMGRLRALEVESDVLDFLKSVAEKAAVKKPRVKKAKAKKRAAKK